MALELCLFSGTLISAHAGGTMSASCPACVSGWRWTLPDKENLQLTYEAACADNNGSAEGVVKDTLSYLNACDKIHVSFDVDSLDPSISVGTGTPVPGGLSLDEARTLLTGLCADNKTATLDVVEINPALDTGNAMAEAVLTVLEPLFPILRNR